MSSRIEYQARAVLLVKRVEFVIDDELDALVKFIGIVASVPFGQVYSEGK